MNLNWQLSQAHELLAAKQWAAASAVLQKAVVEFPEHAPLRYFLGVALHALGDRVPAIDAFCKIAEFAPQFVPGLNALATVLIEEGRYSEAVDVMNRAAEIAPDDAQTQHKRGVVIERIGNTEAALVAYNNALIADPKFIPSWLNRGTAFMTLGRFEEAVENNRLLVAPQPNSADAHFNLSESLLGLGKSEEALIACDRAIDLDPRHARAHIDRGLALSDLGRFEEAQRAFDSAESILLGAMHSYINGVAPADPSLDRSFDPRLVFLYRGYERLARCDWLTRDLYISRFAELVDDGDKSDQRHIDLPLAYHCLTVPVPPVVRQRIATTIGRRYTNAVEQVGTRLPHREGTGLLRIGYLSADFCEHLNAYLTLPLFSLHDRRKFEVVAYSIGPDDGSAARDRVRERADKFVDLGGLSDLDSARLINQDGVNVLIDLAGYTQHCRPGIAAFRPAPVQVSYLGFPGTMGAPWIDYRLTDRVATPPEQTSEWTEFLVYLPETFFIYDRFEPLPALSMTRAQYGLPENAFVFCAFNNYYKIEPEIFGVWMEILKAVPFSVLWLSGKNENAMENLHGEAQQRGVSAERLIWAPFEERDRYRGRYRLADLFLDTPIFNAMTIACDALAAGLPLLTVAGARFPSRVAASLLTTARFREGITDSLEEYRKRAVNWGNNPGTLAELRRSRLSDPLATPQFDTESRVRQLESAYAEMWWRHNLGLPPDSFNVIARNPAWRNVWF